MAILEMKHISKAFSGVYANEDIDLAVEKGEIHALLGENRAGKQQRKIQRASRSGALCEPHDAAHTRVGGNKI